MKIFLTSDIHLGMKFAGYPGIRERLVKARFDALRRCVDTANKEECELFAVGGDLFDRVSVAKGDIKEAAGILSDFQGRLVAVLPGNHDFMTRRPDGLWAVFKDFAAHHILVLESAQRYSLEPYDLDITLYPAPCQGKHSAENGIGWIKEAEKDPNVRFHIGIAHGSLEGLSPDFNSDYYPMTESELLSCRLDLWLMGHTHRPYPVTPGPKSTVFYPGTPEPDGFDCNHEGKALIIDLKEDKDIGAVFLSTGSHCFIREEVEIGTWKDVEKILTRYSAPSYGNTLLKLKMKGRLPEDEHRRLGSIRQELENKLCLLEFDSSRVTLEITADVIEREFTEGSFPHRLLKELVEDRDFEALQAAYEVIKETQQ